MADHPTLVKPPPVDPSKSAIENVLDLTDLSPIGPVRTPAASFHPFLTQCAAGHVHEHQAALAPPRSPRHIRRCCDRPLPCRSAANRSLELHSPQYALLLCTCGRQRDPGHVLRRTRPGREIVCYPNSASETEGEVYIHDYDVVCAREFRRSQNHHACNSAASGDPAPSGGGRHRGDRESHLGKTIR
jgi:hypothetical protein